MAFAGSDPGALQHHEQTNALILGGIQQALEEHLAICRQLVDLSEAELRAMSGDGAPERMQCQGARRDLLPKLATANQALRDAVDAWQRLPAAQRQAASHIATLVRQGQEEILKLTALDRELEQAWLRRGAGRTGVPAAKAMTHFVSDLYQRMASP